MSSFTSNEAGKDHHQLNALYRQLTSQHINKQQFVQQLETLGYAVTPSLYRLLNCHTALRYVDVVNAVRKTQCSTNGTMISPNVKAKAARSIQSLDRSLYHPTLDQGDNYRGGQGMHGSMGSLNDVLQESRWGSYNAEVQQQVIGGAESVVLKELRKMLKAQNTLTEAIEYLCHAPSREGINILFFVKKMKSIGVFLERGEIRTIQQRFPTQYKHDHINANLIGNLLRNTILDGPSIGRNTTYVPTRTWKTSADQDSNYSYDRNNDTASSVASSSILSSATNGTANHIPGHTASAQSFSKVQDEYILIRMLKNLCKDGTVTKLHRLRDALNQHGAKYIDAAQAPRLYTAEVHGMVNFYTFKVIINECIPSIPESDLMAVFDNLYPDVRNQVSCSTFYYRMRGAMSKQHIEAIDAVFQGLLRKSTQDVSTKDEVLLSSIFDNYSPDRDTDVMNGHAAIQDKTAALLKFYQFSTDHSTVTRKAFFDFFGDLSACKPNGEDFVTIMRMPWWKTLSMYQSNGTISPYFPSGERPFGFHRAIRDHHNHAEKSIPTTVRRVLQRVIRDASWSAKSMKHLYDKFDIDGDGQVSGTEFCRFFSSLGIRITADEMDELMNVLDTDGDGVISFDEFMAVVHASEHLDETVGYMGVAAPPHEAMHKRPPKHASRIVVSEDAKATIKHQLEHIRHQLNSDSEFGFRGYGKLIVSYDHVTSNISPWVTRAQFESILHEGGVKLRKFALYEIFNVFQVEHAYQDMLHWWQFLDCISAEWNDRRRRVTHRAFKSIDVNSDGTISVEELAAGFHANRHPAVTSGDESPKILQAAFYNLLNSLGNNNSPINAKQWSRLLRYTMSACELNDDEYQRTMGLVWGIR